MSFEQLKEFADRCRELQPYFTDDDCKEDPGLRDKFFYIIEEASKLKPREDTATEKELDQYIQIKDIIEEYRICSNVYVHICWHQLLTSRWLSLAFLRKYSHRFASWFDILAYQPYDVEDLEEHWPAIAREAIEEHRNTLAPALRGRRAQKPGDLDE